MITIPTKAILIPTHTSPEVDGLSAVQYFDIVYYFNIGQSVQFHSMTNAVPLDELDAHISQMDELRVAMELHVPMVSDKAKITHLRTQATTIAEQQKMRINQSDQVGSQFQR